MSDLIELSRQIHRERGEFSQAFDEVRTQGEFTGSPFMLLAIGLHDNAQAYVKAFAHARDNGWLSPLVEHLTVSRFFTENEQTTTSLQGILNTSEGFDDPTLLQAGLLRIMRQVCLVTVDGGTMQGSGFLVGPNAVITSWHVIAGLLDDKGRPQSGSSARLVIQFDHLSDRAVPQPYQVANDAWLGAASPCHASESAQVGAATTADSTNNSLAGHLDYAIISLRSCPGSERGHVDLGNAVIPRQGKRGYVVQHPQAFQQRISVGTFSGFRPGTNEERLLYTMNTLGGSSGGIVVDSQFRLVALHQGEVPRSADGAEINTGIAAGKLCQQAGADHRPDPTVVPLYRLGNRSGPILGRLACQRWIWECVSGNARMVTISGEPGLRGKTFTAQILRTCLASSEHTIAHVQAAELPVDARQTAVYILQVLGVDHQDLPVPHEGDTSHSAWIKASLFPAFEQRLSSAVHRGLFWLVIDDVDRDTLVDAGVRHFLEVLYREISAMQRLRIILIGFRGKPPGADSSVVIDEEIAGPQESDIDRYLRLRYVESEFEFMNDEIKRLAALVQRSGGSEIKKLSDYVNNTVDRVIETAVREADA